MGGATKVNTLDFNENTYSFAGYYPPKIDFTTPNHVYNSNFTDPEEKMFLYACYTNGLFDLEETYSTTDNICGGGEWSLIIEYEDGTQKTSVGINAEPKTIFDKCSTVFYDLCGQWVMGTLPRYYTSPPNISWTFRYRYDYNSVSSNSLAFPKTANYKWNKSKLEDADIFAINEAVKDKNKFEAQYTYQLILYTANYDYEKKFTSLTVKEYDYNENLTNEKIIFEGEWIKQIELDIELNKIYVYEMTYADGNYVQYTFSTYCPETVDQPTE